MSQLLGYGFTSDSDESLKTKTGASFGANFGNSVIAKFAYNENVAKAGDEPREAIEIIIKVGDREFKDWINPMTPGKPIFGANGTTLTDPTLPEYIKKFNDEIAQQRGQVTHYLKALNVTEEALAAAFTLPVTSFKDYATRICSLLPVGYENKPVDLFLEYQWNFGKKQDGSLHDKTYPTLPKNMKGGYFIVPAQPGVWVEKRNEDGSLCYVNSNGAKHPFERDANFMKSNKGTQQVFGQAPGMDSPMGATAGTPNDNW
jgi:hypothetical protein